MRHRIFALLLMAAGAVRPGLAQEPPGRVSEPPGISLHMAALQGDVEAVARHAAAGWDLDARDAWGSTPLLIATTFGRVPVVRALLAAGADPALADDQGSAPLHVAAFLGRGAVVETLLAHGVSPRGLNADGALAFDLAAVPVARDRAVLDPLRAGLAPLGLELPDADVEAGRAEARDLLRAAAHRGPPVDIRPAADGDWPISTPQAQGLDPDLLARLYADAEALDEIRGLLVVRNGHLVAERYFNDGARERPTLVQSVTKSVLSALVGIALEEGCVESLDQPMLDFFPDRAPAVQDPRKADITLRHMLQMRAGYGWEGADPVRWEGLISGDYLPLLVDFPLERDPGTGFDYSNITSHLLAVAVARACGVDLLDFASEHLFGPLGIEPGPWRQDRHGYRFGQGELHLTARDMARFGLLYLDGGLHDGRPLVPGGWVRASLASYSRRMDTAGLRAGAVGRYFRDAGYGYQWWSARVGHRRVDFAWGHGGQMILLLHDLDTVVVVTSDPFHRPVREDHEAWKHEQANFNLVGRFLEALPPPS